MSALTGLVRTKATAVWLVLTGATLLSWRLGADHGLDHRIASVLIMIVAFTKGRLVGLYFMDLRLAPRPLRLIFEGCGALVFAAVVGMYLAGC